MTTRGIALLTAVVLGAAIALGCGFAQRGKNVIDTATVLSEYANQLSQGQQLTYRAEYDVTGGDKVTLVRQPPRAALLTERGRFIFTAEHMILCQGNGCRRAPNHTPEMDASTARFAADVAGPGFVTPEAVLELVAAAALAPGAKVDGSQQTIAGQDSLCADVRGLQVATTAGPDRLRNFSLCVTDQGVLASFRGTLETGQRGAVQLTGFRPGADPAAFAPPTGARVIDVVTLPAR